MKTEKAINQDREFVAQVIRQLPKNIDSSTKQGWIEHPQQLADVLSEALCPPKEVVEGKITEFPEFMTIKLGTHDSVDALRESLNDNRNRISDWGNDILGKITLADSETEITLHSATVKELTGKDVAMISEINEAIKAKGYDLCPAEVGPQLRLQYGDQPHGEYLRVAMEPITDSDDRLIIFLVNRNNDDRWLYGYCGHPDHRCRGALRFVFVSRK